MGGLDSFFVRFTSWSIVGTGLFLSITEVSGIGHGWPWVIISLGTATMVAFVALAPSLVKELRVGRFFGLGHGHSITLAVGTYGPRQGYDRGAPPEEFLFKKRYNGVDYPLRGVADSIGLSTAIQISEATVVLEHLCRRRVVVVGDQRPEGDLTRIQGPLVALGSPISNFLVHDILGTLPTELRPQFTNDTLIWRGKTFGVNEDVDYAVIVRVRTSNLTSLVCAGISEEGTIATLRYLQENWWKLPSSWRLDTSFVSIFSVSRKERSVSNLLGSARQVPTSVSWAVD
jgi:hypothetical protein